MSSKCVWSADITLHEGFAQGLVCNKCRNIPKKSYGRTCPNNHIYCKYCIERLIKQRAYCHIKECKRQKIQLTEARTLPKVLERIIDELQIKCPNYRKYCKWNGSFSYLSQHLTECKYNSNDHSNQCRERLFSDDNIIYNDKKQEKRTHFGRKRTLPILNKDDMHHNNEKQYTQQKHLNTNKKKRSEMHCPLKSLGCAHKMDITHEHSVNEHFTQYQHQHLMFIINDYEEKFQKLENTMVFLQSQLKFVINELEASNQVIEAQSKQIEHLNHKIAVNIINRVGKPPKKQIQKQSEINEEDKSRGSFDIPIPSEMSILDETDNVHHLCLNDNKRIALELGRRSLSSDGIVHKLNQIEAKREDEYVINNAVIIDNGSGFMKYGYNKNEIPETFPTLIGNGYTSNSQYKQRKKDQTCYVGYDAIKNYNYINIEDNIIKNGIINDWNKMEKIWWHIFRDKLNINPATDCDLVVMNESLLNTASNRERMVQIIFEQFDINSFYLSPDVVLSLHGLGKLNGTAIESGFHHTTICPVLEGVPFKSNSISTNGISGNIVNNWLQNNLTSLPLNNGYNNKISKWKKEFVINNIKEKLCFVANIANGKGVEYKLPDGYNIFKDDNGNKISSVWINKERYECTEQCIMRRLPDLVNRCIDSCSNDIQSLLYRNICIGGGNTMFNGFQERFKNDIKNKYKSKYDVHIISNKNYQKYQCWKGAAVISCCNTINDFAINKKQYMEHGSSIIRRKSFV